MVNFTKERSVDSLLANLTPVWARGVVLATVLVAGGGIFSPDVSAQGAAATGGNVSNAKESAKEGDQIRFTIKLGGTLRGWNIRYRYRTKDRTAVAGEDYERAKGRVVFRNGEKTKTIVVNTLADEVDEWPFETFELELFNLQIKRRGGQGGWRRPNFISTDIPNRISALGIIEDPSSSDDNDEGAACIIWPNC